jgi:hypothetical protein
MKPNTPHKEVIPYETGPPVGPLFSENDILR